MTAIADGAERDPSLAHLAGRLDVVVARARLAVASHRVPDPGGDERFRGLYISDAEVDDHLSAVATGGGRDGAPMASDEVADLLRGVEQAADRDEAGRADLRLRRLTAAFGLGGLEVDVLLAALAPDLDPRLEGSTPTSTTTCRAGAPASGWR